MHTMKRTAIEAELDLQTPLSPREELSATGGETHSVNGVHPHDCPSATSSNQRLKKSSITPLSVRDPLKSTAVQRNQTAGPETPESRPANVSGNPSAASKETSNPAKPHTGEDGGTSPVQDGGQQDETSGVEDIKTFLTRLVGFHELIRLHRTLKKHGGMTPELQDEWTKVCQIALVLDGRLQQSSKLLEVTGLSEDWFDVVEEVHLAQVSRYNYIRQLETCEAERQQRHDTFVKEVSKRAFVQVDNLLAHDDGRISVDEQEYIVQEAGEDLMEATENCNRIQHQLSEVDVYIENTSKVLCTSSEEALQSRGLLMPSANGFGVFLTQDTPGDRQEARTPSYTDLGMLARGAPRASIYDHHATHQQPNHQRPVSKYPSQRQQGKGTGRLKDGPTDYVTEHENRPKSNITNRLRERKRQQLKEAEFAYLIAVRENEDYIDSYRQRLADFLEHKRNGDVSGTQEEFDCEHLIERRERADREDIAQRRYEFIRQEAKRVGAIAEEDLTSDFGDPTCNGDEDIFRGEDIVWEDKKARIDMWRKDEKQKDIECESQWCPYPTNDDPGSNQLECSPTRPDFDERASGRQKEKIQRWHNHQEQTRLKLNEDRLMSMLSERKRKAEEDDEARESEQSQRPTKKRRGSF
jgi:hypothetical protein